MKSEESTIAGQHKSVARSPAREMVVEGIEASLTELQGSIGVYIRKFHLLMSGEAYQDIFSELLHETIAAALESADSLKPGQPVIAWLRVIAMNKAREMARRQKRMRGRVESINIAAERKQPGKVSPENRQDMEKIPDEEKLDTILYHSSKRDLLMGDQLTSFKELLSLVNEKDAQILEWSYLHNMSNIEIAAELGISEGAANVRMSRARNNLKVKYRSSMEKTRKEGDQDE